MTILNKTKPNYPKLKGNISWGNELWGLTKELSGRVAGKQYKVYKHTRCLEKLVIFAAFLSFVSLSSLNIQAQVAPVKQWDRSIGGLNGDEVEFIEQTSDGGYLLGGYSGSGITGDKSQSSKGSVDFWLVKVDALGNKIWDRCYGGNKWDTIKSFYLTSDLGVIMAGQSDSDVSGDKSEPNANQGSLTFIDYWIVKIDSNGVKQWDKTYGGLESDYCRVVKQTLDGGYIVGGDSWSGVSGNKTLPLKGQGAPDFWILKLDTQGNKIWEKSYGGGDSENLWDLVELPDSSFLLAGDSFSGIGFDKSLPNKGNSATCDYWILKIDKNGNKLWDKTYGGDWGDRLYSLTPTHDKSFALAGWTNSQVNFDRTQPLVGHSDFWIIKIDSLGNKLWDKIIGGPGQEDLPRISATPDKGFILGGVTFSGVGGNKTEPTKGYSDIWLIKLDSLGNVRWDKTLGTPTSDTFFTVKPTSDGGYIVGSGTSGGQTGDKSEPSKGNYDMWVIKLGPEILGDTELAPEPAFSVFPNPNSGRFQLQFSGVKELQLTLEITDLLGRTLYQEVAKVEAGVVNKTFNLRLTRSIYFLQLKAGNKISTRKIVIE